MRIQLVLPFLALTAGGCSDTDAEKLRKVGDKTYDRVTQLAQQTIDELGRTLFEKKAVSTEPDIAARVEQRLKWDRDLEGLTVSVSHQAGTITLKGIVKTASQQEKAVVIAEQTVGVTNVTNELTIAKEASEE